MADLGFSPLIFWHPSTAYAKAVAHLAPPGRHVQLKECCGREQRYPPSSTCFEHCYAHLQEEKCIRTASGIVTVFR